jgi:hypothetical protein
VILKTKCNTFYEYLDCSTRISANVLEDNEGYKKGSLGKQ